MMPTPAELKWLTALILLLAAWLTWLVRSEHAQRPWAARLWRTGEEFVSQFLMLMMLATATVQILGRYVLPPEVSLPWTEEAGRLFMVWGALWGAAALQRTDEHICMTAVFANLPKAGQRVLLIFSDLATGALLVPITLWGWQNARGLDIMTSISLGLPLSIFAYSVPVTGALMIVYSIALLVRRFIGQPVPVSTQSHDI